MREKKGVALVRYNTTTGVHIKHPYSACCFIFITALNAVSTGPILGVRSVAIGYRLDRRVCGPGDDGSDHQLNDVIEADIIVKQGVGILQLKQKHGRERERGGGMRRGERERVV